MCYKAFAGAKWPFGAQKGSAVRPSYDFFLQKPTDLLKAVPKAKEYRFFIDKTQQNMVQ